MFNKRTPVILMAALVIVAVVMVAGMPFAQFGWSNVQAQYAPSEPSPAEACGGNPVLQVGFLSPTSLFADSALRQGVLTIRALPIKLLICPTGSVEKVSWRVYYSGKVYFVTVEGGTVGPRGLNDRALFGFQPNIVR